jgi:hypothetical protein
MSYHCFSRKNVIARKQHACAWCGQAIDKGTQYVRENSIYFGDFQNHAWHLECDSYTQNEVFGNGDDEFIPYSNERPTMKQAYPYGADICDNTM